LLRRLIQNYCVFATYRENIKYVLMEGAYALRRAFLSIADRLVAEGRLQDREDIFYLTNKEIQNWLSSKDANSFNDTKILKRKKERELNALLETPNQLSSSKVTLSNPDGHVLVGIGCSPGTITGKARVIMDISDMKHLIPGEILVTPHTDPGWTPLFLSCSGLVTEIGGFLSHGATVAREYGIPAVVNVRFATKKIRTGDALVLDGTEGRVTIQNS